MTAGKIEPNGNGGSTKESINAVKADVARHQDNIDELYSSIATNGRTNWQTLLAAVGAVMVLIGGLWALTSTPVDRDIRRLEAGSAQYERRLTQIETNNARQDSDLSALRQRADTNRDQIKERVTEKEFTAALASSISQREALQRGLDAMNKKIDDVFPPQKTLEDLTRRLAELERTRALQNQNAK